MVAREAGAGWPEGRSQRFSLSLSNLDCPPSPKTNPRRSWPIGSGKRKKATGEENEVPNPKNLTAAARPILPRPFGARAGRGRVPRTPGGIRKGAATLDAILHCQACPCGGRNQPHHCYPKREARRERARISCRRRGEIRAPVGFPPPNHSPWKFSLFIVDSHLPVALTASSASGCTVSHVGLSQPALDGRRHGTRQHPLLQTGCQLRASAFRVGSSPQHILKPMPPPSNPPTPNLGPNPETDYRRDCPRSKPRVGGEASPRFCHPPGEAFMALWGWGNPLVRFLPSPPTLSGPELEGDDANLPRRRISEDS